MTEPDLSSEQIDVLDWLEDPDLPTPTAEEAAERFRAAGIKSPEHARKLKEKLKRDRPERPVRPPRKGGEMADTTHAGGKPSQGTPADKRIKENKKSPKK